MVNPCLNASQPFRNMPFCNFSLPLDARVRDAISRLTLAEKIGNLGTGGMAIAGLGIPACELIYMQIGIFLSSFLEFPLHLLSTFCSFLQPQSLLTYVVCRAPVTPHTSSSFPIWIDNFWSEATHGVATGRFAGSTPSTTNFAFPITTSMSFNRSLWSTTGTQVQAMARPILLLPNCSDSCSRVCDYLHVKTDCAGGSCYDERWKRLVNFLGAGKQTSTSFKMLALIKT